MQTLLPSLDLAAASLGQLSVDQATEAIVGTLNSYAYSADKAIEITDKLVQTTMLTNFQAKILQPVWPAPPKRRAMRTARASTTCLWAWAFCATATSWPMWRLPHCATP